MYQNQEQARRSAQEYASQIDEVEKVRMSLSEADDNGRTVAALNEQNRLVDEQEQEKAERADSWLSDDQ
jgi:hypothetical protein